MGISKRIVCLANSRKLQGRCIAGCEVGQGKSIVWIRPVSDRPEEEVSKLERQYEDGTDPAVLDIMDVPLIESRPIGHQQENWLIDHDKRWRRVGSITFLDLERFTDQSGTLWLNGHHTYHGINDFIPVEVAVNVQSSLMLVGVDDVQLNVFKTSQAYGNPKRRVQARFQIFQNAYWLWVTDPIIEREYLAQGDGLYSLGPSYLTISLGEPFNNCCYKLVAAVIPRG